MAKHVPTTDEVRGYIESLSNWGRWGEDDELGTINTITPEKRLQAVALVMKGITVTLSRPIVAEPAADAPVAPVLYMIESGEGWNTTPGKQGQMSHGAMEYIGMSFHSWTITHVDSLAHVFWKGKMYNGHPAEMVRTRGGAQMESIDLLKDGVVSRGVLLDMAAFNGVDYMKRGEAVFPEDLDAAAERFNVHVEPGDVLFIRTGNWERRQAEGPVDPWVHGASGIHAACLPWLHQRDVAMLGGDMASDVLPSGYSEFGMPIHTIGIPVMGCWLIDNCNLGDLSRVCKEEGRWEFLVVVNPLRLANGTGGPVNPIAIF